MVNLGSDARNDKPADGFWQLVRCNLAGQAVLQYTAGSASFVLHLGHQEKPHMAVKPIPDGYHTVTPYLTVVGVAKLIDFLKRAFDAKELHCMTAPDGSVMHGEVPSATHP